MLLKSENDLSFFPNCFHSVEPGTAQRKSLTNGVGSENLRRAIDEYWERFVREGKERPIRG
jgi:hypothetical protein